MAFSWVTFFALHNNPIHHLVIHHPYNMFTILQQEAGITPAALHARSLRANHRAGGHLHKVRGTWRSCMLSELKKSNREIGLWHRERYKWKPLNTMEWGSQWHDNKHECVYNNWVCFSIFVAGGFMGGPAPRHGGTWALLATRPAQDTTQRSTGSTPVRSGTTSSVTSSESAPYPFTSLHKSKQV